MTRPLRVVVADDERDTREYFQELLPRLGHQVVGVADTGRRLVEVCRETNPDLVLTDIRMPDMDGLEAAALLNRERRVPVVLVTAHHDSATLERAGADCVMGFLVKPVKESDVRATMALAMTRFNHLQSLADEAGSLRQALEDRKLIERAKGVLVKRLRSEEQDAFRHLQKLASNRNQKLVDVARTVLSADEIFQAIEKL